VNYQKAQFVTSYFDYRKIPAPTLPEIAFAGRSNVGKSSLLNKIFQRKGLVRTSATPGKTASINFFRVENCHFVDLPGYGYAKVSKGERHRWGELMEGYFADRPISLCVLLLDLRHAPSADDHQMADYLLSTGLPFVLVLTKADKLSKTQREKCAAVIDEALPDCADIPKIIFSSQTGEGVDVLRRTIEEAISQDKGE